MGLFTPQWKSTDPQKRLKGIEKLQDEQKLFELVFDLHSNGEIALACTRKIRDQQMLAAIAKNSYPEAARVAFAKVHIKALLEEIAQNATDWSLRKEAWIKLGEIELAMVEQAGHTPVYHRIAAVQKIQNPYLLARVAIAQESDAYYQTYGYAIEQIGDQELLFAIVSQGIPEAGALAVQKILDQQLLKQILQDQQVDDLVRSLAAEKVVDKTFLLQFTHENSQVKESVIQRLEEL